MTNRQLYDKIYDIVNENIQWQEPYKADKISENIAIKIMNLLGDDNE